MSLDCDRSWGLCDSQRLRYLMSSHSFSKLHTALMMNRFVPYEQTNKVMKTPDSFDDWTNYFRWLLLGCCILEDAMWGIATTRCIVFFNCLTVKIHQISQVRLKSTGHLKTEIKRLQVRLWHYFSPSDLNLVIHLKLIYLWLIILQKGAVNPRILEVKTSECERFSLKQLISKVNEYFQRW